MRQLVWMLVALCVVLLCAEVASAQATRVEGWCEKGNTAITVQGLNSSNTAQGSFPSCTVSVFITGSGGTLATIYSDNGVTQKANPFTAGTDGHWFYYVANGNYDTTLSGTGISSPFNIFSDYKIANASAGVGGSGTNGTITKFTGSATVGNSQITESGQTETIASSGATPGQLALGGVSSAFTASLKGPSGLTASVSWALPNADASGCVQSNGAGVLSISACPGGGLGDPGGNGIVVRTALNTTINRTITNTDTNLTITNGNGVSGNPVIGVASTVVLNNQANTYTAGSKQNFAPNATNPGLNLGTVAGDPGTTVNGDIWYDSTNNLLRTKINGSNVSLNPGGACSTCVTSAAAMTANQPVIGSGSQGVQVLGAMTNGQLIIGSTGATPVIAALATGNAAGGGSDFNIAVGAGSITINLPDASATVRGAVTTGVQTLAGAKTFSSAPTLSSLTAGSVLFTDTGGLVQQDNSNFFWDKANVRLGLGLNSSFTGKKAEVKDAGPNLLLANGLYDSVRGAMNSFPSSLETFSLANITNGITYGIDVGAGAGTASTQTNSIAGYVRVATTNGWPAGVALFGQNISHGNGTSTWGLVTFADVDTSGGNSWNSENDANIETGITANQVLGATYMAAFKGTGTVSAIGAGAWSGQINSIALTIGGVGGTNSVWGLGLTTQDGRVQSPGYAIALGTVAAGNSQSSQIISLNGRDGGGVNHLANIQADLNGNFKLNQPITFTGTVGFALDGTTNTPTFSTAFIKAPNNSSIGAAQAGGSFTNLVKLDASNNMVLGDNNVTELLWTKSNIPFGPATAITITQNAVNAGDPNDGALRIAHTLTVATASNELIVHTVDIQQTNNLTGGGVISNVRLLAVGANLNAGTTTSNLFGQFFGAGTSTGAVTSTNILRFDSWQAGTSNSYSIFDNTAFPWHLGSVVFASLPTGSFTRNGDVIFCSDCKNVGDGATAGAVCVAAGTGSLALRENAAWRCF